MEFGVRHPLGEWVCSPTYKPSNPQTIGIFMEASSHGNDQLLTPCLAPLTSQENGGVGGGDENSSLFSNCGLVFLVISPHPGGHQESFH